MEAEVVASSLSDVNNHQTAESQCGLVDEILRPEKASMNLLVQTDTTNMSRVRTYSTCNIDDELQLNAEDSTLNTMMLNEEVMDQSMDSWTADISGVIEFSDINDNKREHIYVDTLQPHAVRNCKNVCQIATDSVDHSKVGGLKASSPSLNMLNTGITHHSKGRTKGKEESDFNVLHLDDHSITDLESFPLFSMEDDVGTLLEQFEEVSQQSLEMEDVLSHRKLETLNLSTDSHTVPIHRVSSDSSLGQIVSVSEQSNQVRVGNIKMESPEVVKLLKAKSALPTLSKTTGSSIARDARKMPNPEVLKKIKSNNKRKSAILLPDALPSRPDKASKGSKHQSQPVYASKKLRKLLGHTLEDSNSDPGDRETVLDTSKLASPLVEGTVPASKEFDHSISPATPETITAPSTPAQPSGANSGCSTPDVPKRKISLSAYKSRRTNMQKGSSGSNTPIDSGHSTPVKEFEDNTQIIINTVKDKLTAQLVGKGQSKGHEKARQNTNSDFYSIVMDHDYCQVGSKPHIKREVRPIDKVADTWGVNPHGSNKNKPKKTISRCSSLPVLSVEKCEQSLENGRISSTGLSNDGTKMPDLLVHPPSCPIKAKEKPSSPIKQTPPVEVMQPEVSHSVYPEKESEVIQDIKVEADGKQQSSMLKDLLLSPELEKEMKEQAKVDREESMRRMSARSSLSPDIGDLALEDEQFKESTDVLDIDLEEPIHSEEEEVCDSSKVVDIKEINRFSKFESEKENTILSVNDAVTNGTNSKKSNPKFNKKKYRKKDRSKSPENPKEPYFDKVPNYYTALAHKNNLEVHKSFVDINRLANSGLPLRDRDPSPEQDSAVFNKVPAYFQCFTNSTRYDNMPERASPILGEDSYLWAEKVAHGQKSNSSSRTTSPSLIINTDPNSRANSRSRLSSRATSQVRTASKSPTTVTSYSSGRVQRSRKRSYSSSSDSRSRSRSYSRSLSRSRSRSRSRSKSRTGRQTHRSRSPGYRRHSKRRKYSRSRSRSTSWERWKTEQRKRREEEKRSKMKQRKIVYVGGIPDSYTKKDLRKSFNKFGKIDDVSLHFREHGDNYGFVTFSYRCDAFAAVEKGKSQPGCQDFDLCFGGRRMFCKTRYEDLDGNKEDEEEMAPVLSQSGETLDFDNLLRQALKK